MLKQLSDGQYYALKKLLDEYSGEGVRFLVGYLLKEKVDELVARHWCILRDRGFPYWMNDDWDTVSKEFSEQLQMAKHKYLETLGQERLF